MSEPDLAAQVYVHLGRLVRSLRQEPGGAEVGPGGLSVLVTLTRTPSLRVGALAEAEGVSAASMTRIVHVLSDLDLVRRAPDPTDGRAQVISATDAGRRLVSTGQVARLASLRARIDGLDPRDRKALRAALPALEALATTDP